MVRRIPFQKRIPHSSNKKIFNLVLKSEVNIHHMLPIEDTTESFMEDISEEENGRADRVSLTTKPVSLKISPPDKPTDFSNENFEKFRDILIKAYNLSKRCIKNILDPISLKNRMDFIFSIFIEEFGSFGNMLRHLFSYNRTKGELELFLQSALNYKPPEFLLKQKFEEGVEHFRNVLQNQLRDVSFRIRNLPHMTEDNYVAIRSLISKKDGSAIPVTETVNLPNMYSLTVVKEHRKKTKLQAFLTERVSASELDSRKFSLEIENLVKKETLEIKELVPHLTNSYDNPSETNELRYCSSSLWESNALFLFQIYKIGGFKHTKGVFRVRNLGAYDGSVVKYAGMQIVGGLNCLMFDPELFIEQVKNFFDVPLPHYYGFFPETKIGVKKVSTVLGTEVARMEAIPFQLNDEMEINFEDNGISVDGAMSQKLACNESGTANHKCPFCNACFAKNNIEILLSQIFLNTLKDKNYKTMEELDVNIERRKRNISKRKHGKKSLSTRQIDDLVDFFEEEKNNKNTKLEGITFSNFGAIGITGYDNVNDLLKQVIESCGGKFEKSKKNPAIEFVLCSYNSSKRILNKFDHPLRTKKLVSIKYLAAVVFGHTQKEDFVPYQFTKNTPESDNCDCKKDSLRTGTNELPNILKAYWKEIHPLFPNDEEKAERYYDQFIKRSKVH
eukprot:TRINITY_DN342_c0_g1_i5.p1 TRINITY_DN342_c0_g1~~TRINITY_DN342_c0_g1_i5.p1  ORF type:complete len:673 (-),score=132.73 TRINITY_DN342_c0_g1_i5:873-2891(-)